MLITTAGFLFFLFFGLSYAFFGFAISCTPVISPRRRHLFAFLSAASGIASVFVAGRGGFLYSQLWILTSINATLHAFAVLVLDGSVVEMRGLSFRQRLRLSFRHWNNVRYLHLADSYDPAMQNPTTRVITFAIRKSLRIFCFWSVLEVEVMFANALSSRLGITAWDMSPPHQGLVPEMVTAKHVVFRGYESIRWIIYTYSTLTAAHDLFAVIFVSLLRWDQPSEWPRLYGSLTEAYTLRRFWGVFWHRLNLGISDAFSPPFGRLLAMAPKRPNRNNQDKGERKGAEKQDKRGPNPAVRALWVFVFSAFYHAAANWAEHRKANVVPELKFFLANFAVCFAETIVQKAVVRPRATNPKTSSPGMFMFILTRLAGYIWVYLVFFVLVPGWKWPMVWEGLQERIRALHREER